ncbi:MAG: acyl carrier protein [Clostridia bacterium]|nr:acyl carrier protein [Clostridia bacterium]
MEELLEILKKIKPGVKFEGNEHLIDNEELDSLSIVEIVAAIDNEFDVEIPVKEVVPENFNSVEAMWNLIQKLLDE